MITSYMKMIPVGVRESLVIPAVVRFHNCFEKS